MSGIFAPKSDGYADVPLLEGEQIIRQQASSVDGKSIWGGQLVLTNQRLLFRPVDMKGTTKLINDGIEFLPDNLAVLGKVVSKALDYTTAYQDGLPGAVPTTAIGSVGIGRNGGLFHPPSLVLTLDTGNRVEFGILKSKFTPNIAPSNRVARDEMVQLIKAQMAAGGLA
jgi:hypothetical protein